MEEPDSRGVLTEVIICSERRLRDHMSIDIMGLKMNLKGRGQACSENMESYSLGWCLSNGMLSRVVHTPPGMITHTLIGEEK